MTYSVEMTRQASNDIRLIFEYIAFEIGSLQNAAEQLGRLENKILSLNKMPERHKVYDDPMWVKRKLRMMPVDNYCVFYLCEPTAKKVVIIRVIYSSRDMERELGQLLID